MFIFCCLKYSFIEKKPALCGALLFPKSDMIRGNGNGFNCPVNTATPVSSEISLFNMYFGKPPLTMFTYFTSAGLILCIIYVLIMAMTTGSTYNGLWVTIINEIPKQKRGNY